MLYNNIFLFILEFMKTQRVEALADGIFAIVTTLLVFEIHVPQIAGVFTEVGLWEALKLEGPALMSYILSFGVLFTYWRAHQYLMGIYARTVDTHLLNINALFFLFVAIVPFSADLLGTYPTSHVAISVFGVNIILIGLSLWWMRVHLFFTDDVENEDIDEVALKHGMTRTIFPVVCAICAVAVGGWSPFVAILFFALGVLFNLSHRSTRWVDHLLGSKTS